jgi:hypothetical protein
MSKIYHSVKDRLFSIVAYAMSIDIARIDAFNVAITVRHNPFESSSTSVLHRTPKSDFFSFFLKPLI